MEILRNKNNDQKIILSPNQDFKLDLGWGDAAEQMDKEILYSIINPTENYETVRFVHSPYTSNLGIYQTDIWYYFYFLSGTTYTQDYEATGLTLLENYKMLKQSTESFFRLEFYKTPNDDAPTLTNRRLVFSKNLSLPLGEKIFYTGTTVTLPVSEYIHFPVFMGSNYRNTENMYLFWFEDETAFNETNITGNTFYMTAKYYNAKDGTIMDFTNSLLSTGTTVNETNHLYYKIIIDRTDFSYQVFQYNGSVGSRKGQTSTPIRFYQKRQ